MFLLRYNRKLLWAALGAAAWAYLGIAAALAQADSRHHGPPGGYGEPGPRHSGPGGYGPDGKWHRPWSPDDHSGPPRGMGLKLRMPPGAVALPGRVVEVREEGGRLHIALEVKDESARVLHGAMGEVLTSGPPDVEIEYLTLAEAAGRELSVSTAEGQTKPMQLPLGKRVIVGQNWFVSLNRSGAALIPHDGSGRRLLSEHRGFWRERGPRPEDGMPPGMEGPARGGWREGDAPMAGPGERREERRRRWRWPWEPDEDQARTGPSPERQRRGPGERRGPGGEGDNVRRGPGRDGGPPAPGDEQRPAQPPRDGDGGRRPLPPQQLPR